MRCGKYIDETCSKTIIVELGFDYENIEKCFYESFDDKQGREISKNSDNKILS